MKNENDNRPWVIKVRNPDGKEHLVLSQKDYENDSESSKIKGTNLLKTFTEPRIKEEDKRFRFGAREISEALDEIRDQKSLVFWKREYYKIQSSTSDSERCNLVEIIPAKIKYRFRGENEWRGEVSLIYDVTYISGNEYLEKPKLGYRALIIKDIGSNNFELREYDPEYRGVEDNTFCGDRDEILEKIKEFKEKNNFHVYSFKEDGYLGYNSEAIDFLSKEIDEDKY